MSDFPSTLDFDLACSSPFSDDTLPSASPDFLEKLPVDTEKLAGFLAETSAASSIDYDTVAPQKLARALADRLCPAGTAKERIARIHREAIRHDPEMSHRRVRAIYDGECDRLWDTERRALKLSYIAAVNAARRAEFSRSISTLLKGMAYLGCPLSAQQTSAIKSIMTVATDGAATGCAA